MEPKTKPLYVIKIEVEPGDGGYYAGNSAWKPVPREQADRLTHKEAYRIRGKMKRLGYFASVEPYKKGS